MSTINFKGVEYELQAKRVNKSFVQLTCVPVKKKAGKEFPLNEPNSKDIKFPNIVVSDTYAGAGFMHFLGDLPAFEFVKQFKTSEKSHLSRVFRVVSPELMSLGFCAK